MITRLSLLVALLAPGLLAAAEPHGYGGQVRPFLMRYCVECHNSKEAKSGLNLETYAGLRAGGEHGAALSPGKADESRIVRMVEGKAGPKMPPKKARQPAPSEVGILREWVNAGAKDDGSSVATVLSPIRPRVAVRAPVAALAYRRDGKLFAAGSGAEVFLIDPANGDVVGTMPVEGGRVTALVFDPEGRHFAVASGTPGSAGDVRVFAAVPGPALYTIAAHTDLVYGLTFSPDGRTLATSGYDRLVRLWDVVTGKEIRTLRDHSDAVYSVAFSPDGKLLATAAADRAVKVWDAATGARLHTLGDSTDWVYSLAWSPDGRHLAAAGVDKSIRVWEVTARDVSLTRSVFAHEAPVTAIEYSADGKTLFSLGEDRVIKVWDAGPMVERVVLPRLPEASLALSVRPDGKQIAIGRYDGVLTLVDAASGKTQFAPLPSKPKPPIVSRIEPANVRRGTTTTLRLLGKNLTAVTKISSRIPDWKATIVAAGGPEEVKAEVTVPPAVSAGYYPVSVEGLAGQSAAVMLAVDAFPAVAEAPATHVSPKIGQPVTLPATISGTLSRAGEVDWYRFEAAAGQEIGAQVVTSATAPKLEPALTLTDAQGHPLAESDDGLLGYRCREAGTYALGIRDRDYRGESAMSYRINVGDLAVVNGVFPLGLRRGTETDFTVDGVNLGPGRVVRIKAPADAAPGMKLPVTLATPQGQPLRQQSVVVGEFNEVNGDEVLSPPCTANGWLPQDGSGRTWRFHARKGQRLLLEVNARRLGSPLDSTLEVLDAGGKPLARTVLRCLTKTYVAFRDHNSTGSGIRIETWRDLAVNDYVLLGGEVLRIRELPKNPDDDCQFFSESGQRLGYFGTTPTYHSMGEPLYKVAFHPPGTNLPPNGLPAVTLYYRNDDGGPGYGKDSFLAFDPPADGDYQVRVADTRGRGGPAFAFRLTVRPPRPDFAVSFSPQSPAVAPGSAAAVAVTVRRIDGFDGPVAVRLENLPPGFSAPATTVPAGENVTSFALFAGADATVPTGTAPLKLISRAMIDGKEVVREFAGMLPKLVEAGDLVTTTVQDAVTLQPGGRTSLTVNVDRRNGHAGRVPLEVRGLPHGVRVLDIGLNGILITERESSRTVVLYAEPWVNPTEHPFVVLARSERKGTEHAAKTVLLRVEAPK
jgi:WD40 repeat protein